MNDDNDVMSMTDAAAECGVRVGVFVSQLVDAGLLLEAPDQPSDPRCEALRETFPGEEVRHVDYCGCRFIPSPHPAIRRLERH